VRIRDVMTQPAMTCPVESTAEQAARLMWECDCGFVPLVDEEGRVVGVITDRDIAMAALTQGRTLGDIPVKSAMAGAVTLVRDDDVVESAERLMREAAVRRLPVVGDDDRPVGVLSLNDLARLAARAKKSAVDRELVQTLAAIGRARPDVPRPGPTRIVRSDVD
jgi:CBS domain-containing protein